MASAARSSAWPRRVSPASTLSAPTCGCRWGACGRCRSMARRAAQAGRTDRTWFRLVGRLKADLTLPVAQAQLQPLVSRFKLEHPEDWKDRSSFDSSSAGPVPDRGRQRDDAFGLHPLQSGPDGCVHDHPGDRLPEPGEHADRAGGLAPPRNSRPHGPRRGPLADHSAVAHRVSAVGDTGRRPRHFGGFLWHPDSQCLDRSAFRIRWAICNPA